MAARTKSLVRQILPRGIWTKLRLARIKYGLNNYRSRLVRHTYGGLSLEICLSDMIAEGWYDRDWPELAELTLLKQHRSSDQERLFLTSEHTSAWLC
jgi:hypothetical protein